MGKKYCCVPLCSNTSATILQDGTKVKLHRVPGSKDKNEVRKAWVLRLKTVRANLNVTEETRVCSVHFEGGVCKENAVPTLFPSKPPPKEPKQRRQLIRQPLQDLQSTNCHKSDQNEPGDAVPDHNAEIPLPETDSPLKKPQTVEIGIQVGVSFKEYRTSEAQTESASTCDSEMQAEMPAITVEDLRGQDDKVRFYTGFVSFAMMMCMFTNLLKHGADRLTYWEGQKRFNPGEKKTYHQDNTRKTGKQRKLRPEDEFLMCCIRMRLGTLQEHLADMFCVSVTTVSRVLNTWINFMFDHCRSLVAWPTREQILWNLPKHFTGYNSSRIVVDCTEFFTEKPSSLVAQWHTWSDYKHNNTFKVLIGVSPSGMVTFVSRLWGGHASDRHITQHGDLLARLEPGDSIMADKGFTVGDLLPPGIGLNMPPRIPGIRQMTSKEFFQTQSIASARIVVEMKMEQIKNYRVLQGTLPLSESHLAEQLIMICAAFTNLLPPLLK